jgi:ATP/maltotriose-dependent transcriptional regulator MalT
MRLLERETQLASLTQYADDARAGSGRLVLVAGEAGVGKSSLLEQLEDDLPDARWAWGACDGLFTPRPLAPMLDVAGTFGGPLADAVRTDAPREQVFAALLEELTSATELIVLVVEDVHWADEATLDLLRFVGRRIRHAHALVLVTYRDEGLAGDDALRIAVGELSGQRSTRRILLPRLSPSAVSELAAESEIDAQILHRLTDGNPFYVTEVLSTRSPDLPRSIRDAVLARATGLSPAARRALDVAALLGARVEPDLLVAVSGVSSTELDELIDSGVLIADGDRLRFRHEIARQAVEASVGPHRARDTHRAALDALRLGDCGAADDARLAYHAEGAGDDPLALEFAARAGERAAESDAHREAAAQFERAIRASGQADVRTTAGLYDAWSDELALLDRWLDSADARQEALRRWREIADPIREGDTLRRLSRTMWRLCRGNEADAAARAAIAALEPAGPTAELAWAYANLANHHMNRGDYESAITMARQARELAERFDLPDVLSDALNTEACSANGLDLVWAPLMHRSLEVAKANDLDEQAGRAFANLYSLYVDELKIVEGEGIYVEGLAYCEDHDITTFATCLRGERCHVLERLGRWDDAAALAEELLSRKEPSPVNRLNPLATLGRIRARQADPSAWTWLDEALELAEGTPEAAFLVFVRIARAEACWLEGRQDDAVAELEAAEALAAQLESSVHGGLATWRHRITGERTERSDLSEPWRLEAQGEMQLAVRKWDDLGFGYSAALALLGSDQEADLRDAVNRLEQLGATSAARLARQRMRDLGLKSVPAGVRASTKAHPAGLTRREAEVLSLVAEGLTNDEIAARLFVSVRTVDHHVSAILGKLGVPSRRDAAAEATRLGLVGTTT